MKITSEIFGNVPGKGDAGLYSIANSNRMILKVTNYGAAIQSILIPDREGVQGDVVLGFDRLEDYLQEHPYIGTTVGRFANRIAGGRFTIGGEEYRLVQNNGANHLHGGAVGFDKILWEAEDFADGDGAGVSMKYFSHDMEEGYPGNLQVRITYTLDEENQVRIDYEATTDKSTHINLTNHSYFNLSGRAGKIHDHEIRINASSFLVSDDELIPTGEIMDLTGSPLDLREPRRIGDIIEKVPGGFDHCYVLDRDENDPVSAALVTHSESGRTLEVFTTEPGVQFYSSNFLTGIRGKGNTAYEKHMAFCLETQHYPDSPNRPEFPSTLLKYGEIYRQRTIYRFSNL